MQRRIGKETTTIRLINQTYFNVKNIKVTWNDGKEQTVNTLGSHDSIDFSSDAGSVYKMDVTGTTQSRREIHRTILRDWSAKIQEYL